jgi:hypothetical protein
VFNYIGFYFCTPFVAKLNITAKTNNARNCCFQARFVSRIFCSRLVRSLHSLALTGIAAALPIGYLYHPVDVHLVLDIWFSQG